MKMKSIISTMIMIILSLSCGRSDLYDYLSSPTDQDVLPGSQCAINSFSFESAGIACVIDQENSTITGVAPAGTDISALVAVFTFTGISVTAAGVVQESGVTVNNFSNTVTYTVTAADGETRNYIVSISVASVTAYSIIHNVSNATDWFGGNDQSDADGYNIGHGQMVYIEEDIVLDSFALSFSQGFNQSYYPLSENNIQNVILLLQVRSEDGSIMNESGVTVTSGFTGGWITWSGLNIPLYAGTYYIVTAYLSGAFDSMEYMSYINVDEGNGYNAGTAYRKQGADDADMNSWTNWGTVTSRDLAFRLSGTIR